ncbi:MAG TPA: ABC transporter permease [Bryobacteraceae bacterium]|nr:ABC transporter permease [Bryobacteraceae bacterium]
MKTLRAWALRLGGQFHKERRETEMAEEIKSHLEMHIADNLRAGMTAGQARREALLKLGGVEPLKEACRDRNTVPLLEHLMLDLRFAGRQLRRTPAFAITVTLVLALGVCANVAIFAFVDAALIKPLPYPDPTRLVAVTESSGAFPRANLSYPDYQDWKRFNMAFLSLEVYSAGGFLFTTPTAAEPTDAGRVSGGFFRTLGVKPLLGRDFSEIEETPGAPRVVVLSYQTWQRRFAGRSDVVGQPLTLSGEPYTVIGVLPVDFHFAPLGRAEFWTTIDRSSACIVRRTCHGLNGVARLKEGVSIEVALANLSAVARQLEQQFPDSNRERGASVIPLAEQISGDFRPILMAMMGGAGLLLSIALVNVASLVLVRSEGRKREMAVRSALGASRARLWSQFVTEGLVLSLAASALGLLFAKWAITALRNLVPADMVPAMPFLLGLSFDWRVLVYTGAVAALAVVLFSATPALHLAVSRMRDGLAEGGRGSAGNAWRRLGSRLVVVELAIAMVLLVGAGLFGKSLYRLLHVELGFRADHLATIAVAAPGVHYGKSEQRIALGRDIVRTVESLPGVQSAALTSLEPVRYNGNTDWIRFVGKPYDGKHIEVNERDVSSEYFKTIGAKLARGRYFTDSEDDSKPKVAIINQTLANKYFPSEDPIGKQIGDTTLTPKSIKTIIGVIEDVRDGALDSEIWPAEYHPFNQDPDTYFVLMVRTSQRPEAVLAALGPAIHQLHPDVGVSGEATMEGRIDNSMTAYLHRSSAWLVGTFAAVALLLAVVGLYGVIAYSVSQRTREIGVRMALGAAHSSVYRLVLKEAGWLAGAGIVLGAAGSVAVATLARKLLFAVSSWDVETLLAVAVVLVCAAVVASFVPARRAASVNPVEALRSE